MANHPGDQERYAGLALVMLIMAIVAGVVGWLESKSDQR